METGPARFKGITEELLGGGMNVRISSCGLSMFPLISTGDKIIIRLRRPLCRESHRIQSGRPDGLPQAGGGLWKRRVRYYQTSGDPFFGPDAPV